MEEPRSRRASLELATSLSMLWLPVFRRPSLQEEGDSSLDSSGLLKRLEEYYGTNQIKEEPDDLFGGDYLPFLHIVKVE